MNSTNRLKTVVLVVAHVAIAAGMVIGYETSITFLKQALHGFFSNAQTVGSFFTSIYSRIIQLDQYILYGMLGGAILLAYDVKLVSGWFYGFRFSSQRSCKHCKIKTIRAERQPLDRVLSVVFPVKRFICLGCGRQYLMSDKQGARHQQVAVEGEFAAVHSSPKRVRNRFR